jgi:predicted transcriptional regulator
MPVDLEQQILIVLRGMKTGQRPVTYGELARRFVVSYDAISRYARNLVESGLAESSMVRVRGAMTPHGLLPPPVAPTP